MSSNLDLLNEFRRHFPITEEWVFLDHAAIAPLSKPVVEAMRGHLADRLRFGSANIEAWHAQEETTRAKVAQLLGAEPEEIAFVQHTTEGLNLVANGLNWRPGDNVVTANIEFPANVYPWWNLRPLGVETRMVPARNGRIPLEDLLAAVDDRTRLLTISWVEFSNGFRHDLEAIGAYCRERGVYFCVDAIQGLGVLPIDVRRAQIDFLAAGAYKWLLGPLGIGVFYCRKELLDELAVRQVGVHSMVPTADYLDYNFQLQSTAQRFQPAPPNYECLYGLNAALTLLFDAGIEQIAAKVLALTDLLVERLQERQYHVLSSRAASERSCIVAFTTEREDTYALARQLHQQRIALSVRAGALRASPHFYNTAAEIDALLAALP